MTCVLALISLVRIACKRKEDGKWGLVIVLAIVFLLAAIIAALK